MQAITELLKHVHCSVGDQFHLSMPSSSPVQLRVSAANSSTETPDIQTAAAYSKPLCFPGSLSFI